LHISISITERNYKKQPLEAAFSLPTARNYVNRSRSR
jgi:hypothetical protein